ncbi:LAETG motif-containing sortase-dependent surface protein [Streptomyces sp. NPDC048172]|uniref:LAETG motif-containing sortase-dependent surface protein n=1 Tax=Streptomyces sp. NPDC048172 TaxID=3365505 RepID=UPI00371AE210
MTAMRRRWQRSTAIVATGAAAFLGTAIAATPAQAHSKDWSVDCSAVSVDLTGYSAEHDNSLSVTAGDESLVDTSFKGEFHKKIDLPEHSKELPVSVKVTAGDDDKFSWEDAKSSPVCEGESPSPSPSESETSEPSEPAEPSEPSETPPSAPTSAAPSSPETSSSAPAAEPRPGGGADLAETGSSSNTPTLVGIAAAVVVLGGGLVAFARKRRSA